VTNANTIVDEVMRESERASANAASAVNGYRVLSNAQFLEKRVEAMSDERCDIDGDDGANAKAKSVDAHGEYVGIAKKAMEAIRGRWAETRDGGLALTGNKYWRPLPAIIGTTAYYHDESCGLDPYLASNPNPERWGPYISSDDDDSSEVSDDSSDSLESDISSDPVSSTSSEGEYSDMEDNLADLDNFNDGGFDDDRYDGEGGGRGGGRDLFASVTNAATTFVKSAKTSTPSYALSFDDVFGDDIRASPSGGLFDDQERRISSGVGGSGVGGSGGGGESHRIASTSSAAPSSAVDAKKTAPVAVKQPKGLFDSDSDSDDAVGLFGGSRKASSGDLFAGPMISDPLSAMKKEVPKLSSSTKAAVEVATSSIAAMAVSAPVAVPARTASQGLLFDSDSDDDGGGLFSTKARPGAVPSNIKRDGLFD